MRPRPVRTESSRAHSAGRQNRLVRSGPYLQNGRLGGPLPAESGQQHEWSAWQL